MSAERSSPLGDGFCSSEGHRLCPTFTDQGASPAQISSCPLLGDVCLSYCAAAPANKSASDPETTGKGCGTAAFRRCRLYLQRSERWPSSPVQNDPQEIPVPRELGYSLNHLWFGLQGDGVWRVGVDGLLGRVLVSVDELVFPPGPRMHTPRAYVQAGQAYLEIRSPFRMKVDRLNDAPRARPELLAEDPFGAGWLFEGRGPIVERAPAPHPRSRMLIRGDAAAGWMHDETRSMAMVLDEIHPGGHSKPRPLLADGGAFCPGLSRYLGKEELRTLFDSFFGF